MNRRVLFEAASALALAALLPSQCSAPTPEQIQAAIKIGCGIVVPISDISVLITKGGSLPLDVLVNSVCSAFKTQTAATTLQAAAASGKLVIHTAGGDVTIDYSK